MLVLLNLIVVDILFRSLQSFLQHFWHFACMSHIYFISSRYHSLSNLFLFLFYSFCSFLYFYFFLSLLFQINRIELIRLNWCCDWTLWNPVLTFITWYLKLLIHFWQSPRWIFFSLFINRWRLWVESRRHFLLSREGRWIQKLILLWTLVLNFGYMHL